MIASKIAKKYNFKLNQDNAIKTSTEKYNISDIIDNSFYCKLGFHKEMYYKCGFNKYPIYYVNGYGGETIHEYFYKNKEELFQEALDSAKRYFKTENNIYNVIETLEHSLDEISKDYDISPNSKNIGELLYKETRNRNHFGKASIECLFNNTVSLSPLQDKALSSLAHSCENLQDENLLMAVIFDRYAPEILEIEFDGGRKISSKTLDYAKKINNKYKFDNKFEYDKILENEINLNFKEYTSKNSEDDKKTIEHINNKIKEIFFSDDFKQTLSKYFYERIYYHTKRKTETRKFQSLSGIYPLLAIIRIISDVNLSQNINSKSNIDLIKNVISISDSKKYTRVKYIKFGYKFIYKIWIILNKILQKGGLAP